MCVIGRRMADVDSWEQDVVDGAPVVLPSAAAIELPLATWERTGDAAVDAALERLTTTNGLSPAEQVEIFDTVHRDLHARLSQGASEAEVPGATERR